MPNETALPTIADNATPELSGPQAAALLLMLFGEEEAATVLSRMEPSEVEALGQAMLNISNVSETDVNRALDQFVRQAGGRTTIGYRAETQVTGMLQRALGADRADNIMNRIAPAKSTTALSQLKWMTAMEIAEVVIEEHPQIIAIVMAHLPTETAGQLLALIAEDIQDDVLFRFAKLGEIRSEAITDIEELFESHKAGKAAEMTNAGGGMMDAAAIMNNVGKGSEKRIIKALAKRDKQLAKSIEDEMFVFADLRELDAKALGTVLRNVENDALVLALKGADPSLSAKMFSCMSARAAQSIQDEIEELGLSAKEDVVAAQRQVALIARKLADEGTIMIGGQGDDFV